MTGLRRRTALATAGAAALGGCAGWMPPQTAALGARAPAGLPRRAELEATPFFAQTEYHCGPAALATALGAAGLSVQPEALEAQIFLPARQGTLQAEMLGGARRHGAVAVLLPGEIEALLREVGAGHPVVVLQNLALAFAPRWHYAVLVGYDLDAGEVVLRSGTTRRATLSLRTFEHTWARSGHWAFVALAPGRLPATAGEASVTQALVAFERVAPPEAALRGYEAALMRWPGSLTLAVGVGNTLHAAGRPRAALDHFERTARRHASAAAWINAGTIALELGERRRARAAAARALAIGGEWNDAARALMQRVDAAAVRMQAPGRRELPADSQRGSPQ